ncbi:MAG: YihY family inner membrane protein [Gallionella sp.]|nr:YihY family inner membrane protein [Gallionella sp.]MDD4946190.1 YihY family inner membrane protein [Gallionella sp.]MDD5612630.1 YihY family inner membrane protein [Gallionella sp.]
MQKNWQDLKNFMRFVQARFAEDRCTQIAASLTFTTLLSLVPLFAIALTLFSAFPVFEDFSGHIKSYLLENLMPQTSGKVIAHYTEQFAESAGRLSMVGFVVLVATAMLLIQTIDQAFNTIWRVTRKRAILKRWVVYWVVLTLAPVLVGASLSLTSWLVGLSMGYAKHIPIFGVGMLKSLPVLLTTLAFAMLFRLVPNRYVPRRHALIGAVVAAVLFETMNRVFGYYISHFPTYKLIYGTFASVPIFLMWIYFSWMTVLLGAVVAAALPHWRTPESGHLPAVVEMLDALRVLQIMAEGMRQGEVVTIPALSKKLRLGFFTLEGIMERLASADLVRKAEGQGWLMVRDAAHIRATELLHLFVLDRSSLLAGPEDDPLQRWLASCAAQLEQHTDVTLQGLFDKAPESGKR